MDYSQFWMNFEVVQEDPELRSLPFSSWPCDIQSNDQETYFAPLVQNSLDSFDLPSHDLLFHDNFSNIFDGDNGLWDDIIMDASMLTDKDLSITEISDGDNSELIINNGDQIRARDQERALTFEEVSQYFSMPIIQAAKELNVGLTLLKKKCRELGIPRWPHRKMKSMQTLIKNVQELGREEGSARDLHVRSAIEILEQEKKLMEMKPSMEMQEKTKRLRQACFKANYKKRRLMTLHDKNTS